MLVGSLQHCSVLSSFALKAAVLVVGALCLVQQYSTAVVVLKPAGFVVYMLNFIFPVLSGAA